MKHDCYVQRATDCLIAQIRRLKQQLSGIRSDTPAESIHQARVASRRLLVILRFFRDVYPHAQPKQWAMSLRRVARKLGRARDLDVQREILESWAAASVSGQGFAMHAVAAQWAAARQKLTPKLERAVREIRRAKTLSRIEGALEKAGEQCSFDKKYFQQRARKRVTRCLSRVTRRSVPPDATELLHQLRSNFRKLRYTLEICRPLNPAALDRLIEQAHRFQDVLGRLHDFDVLRDLLSTAEVSEVSASARHYLRQRCEQEHRKLYRKFEHMWKRWKKQKLRGLIPKS